MNVLAKLDVAKVTVKFMVVDYRPCYADIRVTNASDGITWTMAKRVQIQNDKVVLVRAYNGEFFPADVDDLSSWRMRQNPEWIEIRDAYNEAMLGIMQQEYEKLVKRSMPKNADFEPIVTYC